MSQRVRRLTEKRKWQVGGWLPNDPKRIEQWLNEFIKEVEDYYSKQEKTTVKLNKNFKLSDEWLDQPAVRNFKEFVDRDATLHMQYTQMFTQVTQSTTPTGTPQVQSYQVMFLILNYIVKKWAPMFLITTIDGSGKNTLIGFPINVILNWSMGTVDGYAAFLNKEANKHWMEVLNEWGKFLQSPESCYVLTEKKFGWFSPPALDAMPGFTDEFQCNPEKKHYGFKSWDDFFIRKFRKGRRPVACPDDNNVITSACESLPFDLQYDVQYRDDFWVKGQWYSLRHMLNEDELAEKFVGGTIYQAFLSALNYHRWHSPVKGRVIKAYKIPGTYYSATRNVGIDEASPDLSQGYICQVAARAVIFIEAASPAIGLMCFVAVGMSEVSTCEINEKLISADRSNPIDVEKGQEIGMFHFGGSTHCLLFRPGVKLMFDQDVMKALHSQKEPDNIKLNSKLATVDTNCN